MSAVAVTLLVASELALAYLLGGLTPDRYVATRDAISGPAFAFALALFAAAPFFVLRHRKASALGQHQKPVS
jgi:hypothetical protein